MKRILSILSGLALLADLLSQPSTAFAQGTAFIYQGRFNNNGSNYTGSAEFQATLWSIPGGGTALATNSPPSVVANITNGLFVLPLDFGANFPGADRWLQLEVRTLNGPFTLLSPRQQLTPTPYAITAGNVVPGAGLSGTYTGAATFNNAANIFGGNFNGNGAGVTNVNAATLGGLSSSNFWKLGGNAGTAATNGNFFGTTDNQALEIRVNGMRVLRLEPDPRPVPLAGNFIGGFTNNTIEQPGSGASFIGGGGYNLGPNVIHSNSSGAFIGAGSGNQIGPNVNDAVIGGGFGNQIQELNGVIAGGRGNSIQAFGSYAVIGGGLSNTNNGFQSAISGGWRNSIESLADHAFIGGGSGNRIVGSYLPTVASTIGGGFFNSIDTNGVFSTIGGGFQNRVNANGDGSTIGGGYDNNTSSQYSTIPGGFANQAHGKYSFAAGQQAHAYHQGAFVWADSQNAGFDSSASDQFNVRANGGVRFITGGAGITVDGLRLAVPLMTTSDTNHSNIVNVINGSSANFVTAGVYGATIAGGGASNYLGFYTPNSVTADFGSVGGGEHNTSSGVGATVAGGRANTVSGDTATIGGGFFNVCSGTNATIGGGAGNYSTSDYSTVSGGGGNTANSYGATASGGGGNAATGPNSTVGGGFSNTSSGNGATIPGGNQNAAAGQCSFAAGQRAKANHNGAFVWADSQTADFASTTSNQFNIRANGGVRLNDDTRLFFGTTSRQMLNLWSTNHAVGIQSGTTYFRTASGGNFAWYDGGAHNDNPLNSGGGDTMMTLSPGLLMVNGVVNSGSDRNVKAGFEPVDSRAILEKVAALPITRWHYTNDAATPHLGPVAQDFHAAFGVGTDDKHIGTVDADGVALAAIQGLNQKVDEKEQRIRELEKTVNELKEVVRELASKKEGAQ